MSYLPVDLRYGTGRLKQLNISHNQINGLNKFVLSNLTQLEVLDMSHNDLNDERQQLRFRIPDNLTEFYVNHNNLSYLPIEKLGASLHKLDLRGNHFELIDDMVMKKILNGSLEVNYEGNPLYCSCQMRPLRQFADRFQRLPEEFLKTIVCHSPSSVEAQPLVNVDEALLICPGEDDEISINPDIKYRQVFLYVLIICTK